MRVNQLYIHLYTILKILSRGEFLTHIIHKLQPTIMVDSIGADSFADIQIHPPSSPLTKGGYEGG